MTRRRAQAIAAIGARRIAPVREAQASYEDRRFADRRADDREVADLRKIIRGQAALIRHYQHCLGLRLDPPAGWTDRLSEEV